MKKIKTQEMPKKGTSEVIVATKQDNGELEIAMPSHGVFTFSKLDDLKDFARRHGKEFSVK